MRLALREAIRSFGRAPVLSVLSITTIAFALFVVGLVVLVGLNVQAALRDVGERVEVVVYLQRGTPIEAATVAMEDILTFPEVADVGYVSEEEALQRARAQLTEFQDVFDDLQQNPLPASIEVRLRPEYRDAASVDAVASRLRGFRFAEDVRYGRDWIAKLDRLRSIAAAVSLLISLAFAAASIIIIGTTIRLTVMQRSQEIAIMRAPGGGSQLRRLRRGQSPRPAGSVLHARRSPGVRRRGPAPGPALERHERRTAPAGYLTCAGPVCCSPSPCSPPSPASPGRSRSSARSATTRPGSTRSARNGTRRSAS
jgi:cell division transport system permease protein